MIIENEISFACGVLKRKKTFRFCESVFISLVGFPERDGKSFCEKIILLLTYSSLGIGLAVVV